MDDGTIISVDGELSAEAMAALDDDVMVQSALRRGWTVIAWETATGVDTAIIDAPANAPAVGMMVGGMLGAALVARDDGN